MKLRLNFCILEVDFHHEGGNVLSHFIFTDSGSGESENQDQDQPRKKSRFIGDLDLDSPEVQKLLKMKSSHDHVLTEVSHKY